MLVEGLLYITAGPEIECPPVTYRGGVGVQTHPLRNSEGPPKSCQTQPDCEIC